jgi:hypothetical protein
MADKITFEFGIARIKDLAFEINEEITIDEQVGGSVNFNNSFDLLVEKNIVNITIEARFFKEDPNKDTFIKGKVLTSFFVKDLNTFRIEGDEDNIHLPHQAMATLMSIAVTHTRALIAKATMGSKFNNVYIPVVNPNELIKDLMVTNP